MRSTKNPTMLLLRSLSTTDLSLPTTRRVRWPDRGLACGPAASSVPPVREYQQSQCGSNDVTAYCNYLWLGRRGESRDQNRLLPQCGICGVAPTTAAVDA